MQRLAAMALVVLTLLCIPSLHALAEEGEPELARRAFFGYRSSSTSPTGRIQIADVIPDSGAQAAGLQAGDVIVRVEGAHRPLDQRTMLQAIRSRQPGDVLKVSFRRDGGDLRTADVTLGEFPKVDYSVGGRVWYLAAEVPEIPGVDGPSLVRLVLLTPIAADGEARTGPDHHPHAVVVCLSSMRCLSLEASLGANSTSGPEFAHARELLVRGVAVLLIDRPGLGDSQGPPCETLTWEQERAVYRAALHRITRDPLIDPDSIALLGFGTGGYHAAQLAAESTTLLARPVTTPRIQAVVAVDADDRPWSEYAEALLRRASYAAEPPIQGGQAPRIRLSEDEIVTHLAVHSAVSVDGLSPSQLYGLRPELRRAGYPSGSGFVAGRRPAYFQHLERMNAIRLFARVSQPLLFIRESDQPASFKGATERLGLATGSEWISTKQADDFAAVWLAAELGVPERRTP